MEVDSWDLEAVVRGCSKSITTAEASSFSAVAIASCLAKYPADHRDVVSFAEPLETSVILEDMESIYKPFYPGFQGGHKVISSQSDIETCSIRTSAFPVASSSALGSAALAIRSTREGKSVIDRTIKMC